jgi:hypothetical protein
MSQNKTPTEITCEFVKRTASKLGLSLTEETRSWMKYTDAKTGHKICVSFAKGEAPKVDTTVDITSLPGVLARGVDTDANGRFVSLFIASAPLIEAALRTMASAEGLRPVKRAKARAAVAFQLEGAEASGPVEGQ